MKFKVYILFIYLTALMVLPTVRAVKVHFDSNGVQSCASSEPMECEKGKLVMSLNFSPLQYVKELSYMFKELLLEFDLTKESSFYESFFISFYQNSIWHPPKF